MYSFDFGTKRAGIGGDLFLGWGAVPEIGAEICVAAAPVYTSCTRQ